MLPISLTFQGIYSYQNKTTIDFRSLTSAGMFGIFGAVGSGKSTILDAISLVLYDEIERLGTREIKNIINLRSDAMYIEFDFLAGKENNLYRFSYARKFNKKRELQTAEKQRYIWSEEENAWQPIKIDAKVLLNISYANFKRTIILPQGKFQDFLLLGGTERTDMMIELFNLEHYDIEGKLKPIKEENQIQFHSTQSQLQLLENVTEENIKKLNEELEDLFKEQKKTEKNLDIFKKEKENLDNLEKLANQIVIIQKDLTILENQKGKIIEQEKILNQYKLCKELFAHLFENNERVKKNISSLEIEHKQQIKSLEDNNQNIEKANILCINAEKEAKLKPEIQEKLEDIIKISAIAKAQNTLDAILPNIEKQEKEAEKNKIELDNLNQKINQIKEDIIHKEKEKPQDISTLYEIQKWFDRKSNLAAEVQKAHEDLSACENKISVIISQIKFKTVIPSNNNEIIDILEDNIDNEEQKLEVLQMNLQELILKQKLQEHAEKLIEGEPCPVCGATHHPAILFGEALEEDIKKNKQNIKEYSLNIKNWQELKAELQVFIKSKEGYEKNLQKRTDELNNYDEKFIWRKKGYQSEDRKEVEKQINTYKTIEDFVNEKRKEQQKFEKMTEKLNKEREILIQSLQNLILEKTAKISEIDTTAHTLKHLKNYKDFFHYNFEEKISAGKIKIEKLDKNLKDAQNILQNLNNLKIKLQSDIENTLKNIENKQQELIKNQNEILEKMKKTSFEIQAEIEKILNNQIDIQKTEKEITYFYELLSAKNGSLSTVKAQMQGQNYDEIQHDELKTIFLNTNNVLEEIKKSYNLTEANIKKMQLDWNEKIILTNKFIKIEQRKEDIATIESLFRSKGFAKYVSTAYIENLCQVANKRFRIFTRQQLTLELEGKEDNKEFYVCDFLHEGRKRSVKTLSGGQTFQASLALALALAETVNAFQYSQQNFFFMDEGFGSLDDDSLATVFQTLQTLREENRIVGIISHVEKLKEEIPTFLKVEIDENGGSSVKMVHN
ncbi:MAG: SMC family ATPase [Cytophagia bacterium]|nr:MAG: SMC family ATPase [Cytophagia bacterium]